MFAGAWCYCLALFWSQSLLPMNATDNTPTAAAAAASTPPLQPQIALRPVPAPFLAALQARFGAQYSAAQVVREQHGRDEGSLQAPPPAAVVFAQSTQDVQDALKLASQYAVPVIPYGAGSSLEGHLLAVQGGISIDVGRMNQVLRIDAEDLTVTVQPGITRKALNEAVKDTGLFFPIDPGADASIGGMTATRASGTNAVRYGTMRENVLGLTVVTADGRIVRTGTRARKSAAGYDLTRLFVGSEGTLGIITEVQLRLHGIPEAIAAAVCPFEDLAGAVDTVIATIQSGVPIARVELLDALQIQATNAYSKLGLPEAPTLFFEFHGSAAAVKEQAEAVAEIAAGAGGGAFQWTSGTEERNRLWAARHDVFWSQKALRPGAEAWTTDVCVPISRLAEAILAARDDAAANGLVAPIVGHVGDGNFHMTFLIDPADPAEFERAGAVNARIVERALAMGGTCTGEHGVGTGKMRWVEREQGDAIALMRTLKRALDPDNILNPGKIFRLDPTAPFPER